MRKPLLNKYSRLLISGCRRIDGGGIRTRLSNDFTDQKVERNFQVEAVCDCKVDGMQGLQLLQLLLGLLVEPTVFKCDRGLIRQRVQQPFIRFAESIWRFVFDADHTQDAIICFDRNIESRVQAGKVSV